MSSADRSPGNGRGRPNFVFILADDLGWGDLACFGHGQLRTPCLDRLAAEGARFTQFYVNAPVCSPSRAAFMTGRFPSDLGIHHIFFPTSEQNRAVGVPDFLDPGLDTLPRLLQRAGYMTGHFGKWHLAHHRATDAASYGFDRHEVVASNLDGPNVTVTAPHVVEEIPQSRSTEVIVDSAMRFIADNRDRPFYAQVWLTDPHATLDPSAAQMEQYRNLSATGVAYPGAMTVYYSVVSNLDQQIGRLLARVDELGLAEDTVIVFTSDNGPEDSVVRNAAHSGAGSSGPFRGRKRSLYEGGVRLPLIIRWKGQTPAGRIDQDSIISGVDLLPTFCRLGDAETPSGVLAGEDVSAVFHGATHRRKKPLIWEWRFEVVGHPLHRSPMLAIRSGRWKLLLNPDSSRVELYDVENDVMELNNMAEHETNVVKRLADDALAWQQQLPAGPVDHEAGRCEYLWPH